MADEHTSLTFDAGTVISMEVPIPIAASMSVGSAVDLRKSGKKQAKVRSAVVVSIGPSGRPTRRQIVLRLV